VAGLGLDLGDRLPTSATAASGIPGGKEVNTLSVVLRVAGAFLTRKVRRAGRADAGQGLAEYALILTLIAIASIVVLAFIGTQIQGALSWIGQSINAAGSP
jgi:Flp pilus assembly pilin Flp